MPHSYYYREMYLPQLTTGPSGAAWSPDGAELVYSMGGTLWRQRIGSKVAVQLTAGPGYDYQPDWSPDGRYIAYASYRADAVELRLLDLARDTTLPLVAGGAVNVEPRWSPDGTRIAYVSTALGGRWHVHTVALRDGAAGAIERLTEDRDSGLPRYYYGRYDHYLSPTWSPDGAELIVVSNAGRIWGSGGLWRMPARPGGVAREIHYEETTWKARPDWSRDGRRVVYSSYQGRQWNQLWLMTADGGDPFQLTYGDFDATAPRWSPDGSRIAYVSNEGGNTALWVIDLPGGRRQRVDIIERRYRGAVARLRVEVVDAATGRPLAARVSVTGPDGRSYAPDDAWHHADDAFDRSQRTFEYGYFHTRGAAELTLPGGTFTIEATRGLEYRLARSRVVIQPQATREVRLALERLADFRAAGWHSADLHVHMNYGGTYRNTPERLALQAEAEGLALITNLVVNKEGRIPDVSYFSGSAATFGNGVVIKHDQEFHTSFWGHLGLLGLTEHLLLPDYAAYVNTAAASLAPANAAVSRLTRGQGGLAGYVHPFDVDPAPGDPATMLTHALPVDAALGAVDYLEVVGFSDHRATERVWHRLLRCGFRIPAGAGTDAMANFASLRGPVGMNRAYARIDGPVDHRAWLAALKAGKTFATNGPLLEFTMDGAGIGDELRLPAPRDAVPVQVTLRSIVPVDHVEIVRDGEVAARVPLTGDRTSAAAELAIPVARSGWYTLRAWSERATHPVLDLYPFATTSPIYVTVDGRPPPRCPDAGYFQAWIDRIEEAVLAHTGWNNDAEREDVLRALAAARAEYLARSASAGSDP